MTETDRLRALAAAYREAIEEIWAKATPYGSGRVEAGDEWVDKYLMPAGPLHRAKGLIEGGGWKGRHVGFPDGDEPAEQPMTWRPIETAPRDGTKVVLYHPDWLACPIARWDVVQGSDENGEGGFSLWVLDDENGGSQGDGLLWPEHDGDPTLWAPLPS